MSDQESTTEALDNIAQALYRLSFSGPDGEMGAVESHTVLTNKQTKESSDTIAEVTYEVGENIQSGLESVAAAISELAEAVGKLAR